MSPASMRDVYQMETNKFTITKRIELRERKDWREDYKELAKEIIGNNQDHTIMLIKTLPNMPEQIREGIVAKTFLTAFAIYKEEQDSKNIFNRASLN